MSHHKVDIGGTSCVTEGDFSNILGLDPSEKKWNSVSTSH